MKTVVKYFYFIFVLLIWCSCGRSKPSGDLPAIVIELDARAFLGKYLRNPQDPFFIKTIDSLAKVERSQSSIIQAYVRHALKQQVVDPFFSESDGGKQELSKVLGNLENKYVKEVSQTIEMINAKFPEILIGYVNAELHGDYQILISYENGRDTEIISRRLRTGYCQMFRAKPMEELKNTLGEMDKVWKKIYPYESSKSYQVFEDPLFEGKNVVDSMEVYKRPISPLELLQIDYLGYLTCEVKDTQLLNRVFAHPSIVELMPEDVQMLWALKPQRDGGKARLELIFLEKAEVLTRGAVAEATCIKEERGRSANAVQVKLSETGKEEFKNLTMEMAKAGDRLAVVLGNYVYSAPSVREAIINGEFSIAGNFSEEEAKQLAEALNWMWVPPIKITAIGKSSQLK